MAFYFRSFLVFATFILVSIVWTFYSFVRWGHLNSNQEFARVLAWLGQRITGIRSEFQGLENLDPARSCIYVANHQSGLDMVTFGPIYPYRTLIIGKRELFWVPFFGINFVAAGNFVINRKNKVQALAGLSRACEAIRKKSVSIWIFPEGTRNVSGVGMLPFKKGAFHMAIQAQVPIVAMVSSPLRPLVDWKQKRLKAGVVKIRVLPPISTVGMGEKDVDRLCQEVRDQMIEAQRALL